MALTPDDLQYKEFPETKFRPGYDKDHVDDFLDEIVVQWRQLLQEKDELKSKIASLEEQLDGGADDDLEPADLADAGLSGFAGTSAEVTGGADENGDETAQQPATAYPEYPLGTRPAQTREAARAADAAIAEQGGTTQEATTAAGVLAMAQRLHDQYVSEGEETRARYIAEGEETRAQYIAEGQATRDEYIAEGESTREEYFTEAERRRAEIIADAQTRAENMIEDAEQTSTRTLNALERKKSDLESKVSELTGFERDYRARLKDYIEGQLSELTSRGSIEKEATGS